MFQEKEPVEEKLKKGLSQKKGFIQGKTVHAKLIVYTLYAR